MSATTTIKSEKQKSRQPTPAIPEDSDDDEEELDVPGKKSKSNTLKNQKSLNRSSLKYNNIMLIKNEQIVSNSSSINSISSLTQSLTRLDDQAPLVSSLSVAERQQQNPNTLNNRGDVSDRMSKEKQKFFRFSVFNSERKHAKPKSPNGDNNDFNTNGGIEGCDGLVAGAYDKYNFVSSSDSEDEKICDKKNKLGRPRALDKKTNSSVPSSLKPPRPPSSSLPNTHNNNNNKIERNKNSSTKTATTNGRKKADKSSKQKSKKLSSDTSCCSSESGSTSDESSTSSDIGSSTSTSGSSSTIADKTSSQLNNKSSSTKHTKTASPKAASLAHKTETINTMNVFAAINSRELMSQQGKEKRSPYCWNNTTPFSPQHGDNGDNPFRNSDTSSFGQRKQRKNEVWGFAAEAQKSMNIFNASSDNESRSAAQCLSNISGTESDCHMSMLSMNSSTKQNNSVIASRRLSRSNRDASASCISRQLPSIARSSNHRTITLMRNNTIMSSDDDAKQLTPSSLVRKAVNYKKFDNSSATNSKKLIMDASLNGAKYGADDRPVKEKMQSMTESSSTSNSATTPSVAMTSQTSNSVTQPPYDNNSKNQSDSAGKEYFSNLRNERMKLFKKQLNLIVTVSYLTFSHSFTSLLSPLSSTLFDRVSLLHFPSLSGHEQQLNGSKNSNSDDLKMTILFARS